MAKQEILKPREGLSEDSDKLPVLQGAPGVEVGGGETCLAEGSVVPPALWH